MVAKDINRSRAVYNACIELIPHKLFTFTDIWIRQIDLTAAQNILGIAFGKCPKTKLYKTKVILNWS